MIKVTVLTEPKTTRGMTPDARVLAVPLADALALDWSTDAHLTAYAPVLTPIKDANEVAVVRARLREGTDAEDPNRFRTALNTGDGTLTMVALIGDLDDHAAHEHGVPASEAWRAEIEPKLEGTGLIWYRTKGGARLVALLDTPFVIDSPARAAEWSARYLAWCDAMHARHGIELDRSCKDATRIFRLPNVMRDGREERAEVHGQWGTVALPEARAPVDVPATARDPPPAIAHARDVALQSAITGILDALGDSVHYAGRKHDTACAIGGVLRKRGWPRDACADLVRTWIQYTARDVEAGVRRACEAWDRLPEQVSGYQALEAQVGPELAETIISHAITGSRFWRRQRLEQENVERNTRGYIDSDGWIEFGDTPVERTFLIPAFELGVGRAYGFLGQSNAGKTLLLMQLEIDLALGLPLWGRFAGPREPVPVLRLAWEGASRAAEDYPRLLRGRGATTRDLDGRLRAYDPRRNGQFLSDPDRDWLLRLTEPYGDGIVIIDSLVAACPGVDENSAQMAEPLYALETVSTTNGCGMLAAHHFGHANQSRSRGHSAIEGAFGATLRVEKTDATTRRVTQGKRYRYGSDPFGLRVRDLNEDGSPWTLTPEARDRGECSWSITVDAIDPPRSTEGDGRKDNGNNLASINVRRRNESYERQMSTAKGVVELLYTTAASIPKETLRKSAGEGDEYKTSRFNTLIRKLREAGFVTECAGHCARVEGAERPDDDAIAEALGIERAGGFTR